MKRNILIIGGMGPQASLLLHERIIQGAISHGAKDGEDFPKITHISVPMPDFISTDPKSKGEAVRLLKDCLYRLWKARVYTYSPSL